MNELAILAAIIAVIIFIGLGVFQLLLALGYPYGKAAYGGKYEVLPDKLRYMSIVAIVVLIVASIFVFAKTEIIPDFPFLEIADAGLWFFVFYFSLNTVVNFISESDLEKKIMTPLSLTISICLFLIQFLTN